MGTGCTHLAEEEGKGGRLLVAPDKGILIQHASANVRSVRAAIAMPQGVGILAVAWVASVGFACNPSDIAGLDEPTGEVDRGLSIREGSFRHPLLSARDLAIEEGAAPESLIFLTKDSRLQPGYRLAMVEGVDVDEDGSERPFSGIRRMQVEALGEQPARSVRSVPPGSGPAPRIGQRVLDAAAGLAKAALIDVEIHVERTVEPPTLLMNRAIAAGLVTSAAERDAVREQIVLERQAAIRAAQAAAVARVVAVGGHVTKRYENLHAILLRKFLLGPYLTC